MKVSDYLGSASVLAFKLALAFIGALGGILLGFMGGGLYEMVGIYENLPWQEFLTVLGGAAGGFVGFAVKVEKK